MNEIVLRNILLLLSLFKVVKLNEACRNEILTLQCPQTTNISIINMWLGRSRRNNPEEPRCLGDHILCKMPLEDVHPEKYKAIMNQCEGKSKCSFDTGGRVQITRCNNRDSSVFIVENVCLDDKSNNKSKNTMVDKPKTNIESEMGIIIGVTVAGCLCVLLIVGLISKYGVTLSRVRKPRQNSEYKAECITQDGTRPPQLPERT
ncbi:unnamed protein product, partial [Owenia fusiformis]